MAQPKKKTIKELEDELRVAQRNVDDLVDELVTAKEAEAVRLTKAKAAAERRAKKDRIARKAELDTLLVDYWDVTASAPATPAATARPVAATPAPAVTPARSASTSTPAATTPATPSAKRSILEGLKRGLGDLVEGFKS